MRRLGALGLVVALMVALVACTNGPATPAQSPTASPTAGPTASPTFPVLEERELPERRPELDAEVLAEITWETDELGLPYLVFEPALAVSGPVARLVEDGDGPVINEGDMVTFDYVMFAGDTGLVEFSTYESGQPQTISLQPEGMSVTFAEAMIGRHVGAKIVFGTVDTSGTGPSDYLVSQFMAVTVRAAKSIPQRAQGTAVPPVPGLPEVTLAADGTPSIKLPPGEAPSTLVSQLLIRGDGPQLKAGQAVMVQYVGWIWDATGALEFNSTWAAHQVLSWQLSAVVTLPGLVQGLIGVPVGSQVLLIIPPDLGFGDAGQEVIPGGSTLVYVVDVLDAG